MRNKPLLALIFAAALLLAALGWLTLACAQNSYGQLLLARAGQGAALTPAQVEDFRADEFLLTYEIRQPAAAEAHHYKQPITLIGVNSCYAQLLNYRLLNGCFFTDAAWQAQNKQAVLNGPAAFALFGSYEVSGQTLKINGQSWLITGVINDNDEEEAHVYAPSSVTGGQIEALLALTDANNNSAYVQNALKKLGVYEHNYTIVDVARAAAAYQQRLIVALYALTLLLIALAARPIAGFLRGRLPKYREQARQMYAKELLLANSADIGKMALAVAALLAGLAAFLALSLRILGVCLQWPQLLPQGPAWALGSFAGKLAWLQEWRLAGWAAFALFIIVLALILILIIGGKQHGASEPG